MLTANGAITSVQAITSTVPMTPAPIDNVASTAVGRMFDLPNDVVAVLAMDGEGPPGTFPLNLTIRDPKTGGPTISAAVPRATR